MARIWNIITGSNGGRPPCDVRIDERRVEFRPERPEIHRDPKGLELVAEVACPLPPIIDIKKKPGWPRSESSPLRPPRWNQKCSNLARFLEPSKCQQEHSMTKLAGGCLCGAIRYEINGKLNLLFRAIVGTAITSRAARPRTP
jgi:hypothetical protein